ncbi:hypothetical protein CBR_g33924 [Chara braunii]|uniref:Uncharacterized protein n=1 Tax=Chara braunii TaxID=69332 RepID=A0A388LHF4_CHABU|nr:hypothetical protein CBR_g33924 [Chara braunii]|eukprot:GBG81746.1 hypothetical protein CBR_g33924 [Chara braunii]
MGFGEANTRGLALASELVRHGGKRFRMAGNGSAWRELRTGGGGGGVGLAVTSSLVLSGSGSIAAAVAAAAISSLPAAHCESTPGGGGSCTSLWMSSRRVEWTPQEGGHRCRRGCPGGGGREKVSSVEDERWRIRRWWIPVAWCEEMVKAEDGKVYHIELKSLLSAFQGKAFFTTVIRQIITHFMPVVQYYITPDEEDEDDEDPMATAMQSAPPLPPPDVHLHAKRTGLAIARELAVTTTRRVLERVAVKKLSVPLAWKLTKDIQKSALRKAARNFRGSQMFLRMCRTTVRAHVLQIAAAWLVQCVTDLTTCVVRCWRLRRLEKKEIGHLNEDEEGRPIRVEVAVFAEQMAGNTSRAVGSLAMASAGAGLGSLRYMLTMHVTQSVRQSGTGDHVTQ